MFLPIPMSKPDPGQIQTEFFQTGSIDEPFTLASGETLPGIQLAYETHGKLNARKTNAILIFHALSGSHHVAGFTPEIPDVGDRWRKELHQGWWDVMIGPGKAIDTNRYFVICANYLGGCYGSTGPTSIHPATGKPWGGDFPSISSTDIVRSQIALLDHLGIRKLHAAIGPSVGGLLSINLATLYPERVKIIVPIAAGLRTTVLTRLTLFEQVIAIENDPHFNRGHYTDEQRPEYGLALARMISHKTFVHLDAIERRARKDIVHQSDQLAWYRVRHNVESYMLHQGKKFVQRFDANTYLRIADMWLRYDPAADAAVPDYGALFERSAKAGHHYLVFSIDSDFCFYPEEQAEMVNALTKAGVSNMYITVHSDKGHDSFLLEPELYTPHLHYALQGRFSPSSLDRPALDVE